MGSAIQVRILRHIANLDSPDQDISSRAEGYLIRYYGARALEPLIEACAHPNPIVRFRAAWALAYTHEAAAFETILALTRDPDERVRFDATIALGILGDERAIETLLEIGRRNFESPAAAMGLARIGSIARPAVEQLLRSDDPGLRNLAVNVLADYAKEGDKRSMALVRESLDDPDPDVRAEAEFRLEKIGRKVEPAA